MIDTLKDMPVLDSAIKSEVKKSIIIKTNSEHTHIFVIALKTGQNRLTSISYKEKSRPIAGYTYDAKFGQYYVECYDYLDLGTIPISFSIRIDKISRWESKIPMTESLIRKYLDSEQDRKLKEFKELNKSCRFEYMQLVSCY